MTRPFDFNTIPERHRNPLPKGARVRKARWATRHALKAWYRRRKHPAREVRAAQRFVRQWDQLKAAGALWILGVRNGR